MLIDCPPNMGDHHAEGAADRRRLPHPTIPDYLSTYDIDQIVKRVNEFGRAINESIEPYGIIITKYRAASVVHVDAIRRLQGKAKNGNGKHPPVFKARVPEGNAIASSAEFVKPGTLRQKYAYQGGYETVQDLATEIATAAGI